MRLRRPRPSLESERHRVPRRIFSGASEKLDRGSFLVPAGPPREPIDPIRYLSNRSSGKMGYAIADASLAAGHEVVLISGPVALDPPRAAKLISISTSD